MSHPYDTITVLQGAQFIFTPCPGTKQDDLKSSVATLKNAGTNAVISVLSNTELGMLGVTELGDEIQQQGMAWYQLPIEDDCAPQTPFFDAFEVVKEELQARLQVGETIAIHCRGGSGRTGLMAAILLLEADESWETIKTQIQSIRPKALTLAPHLEFLQQYYLD
jgi:protein-tyrosine phosphatase